MSIDNAIAEAADEILKDAKAGEETDTEVEETPKESEEESEKDEAAEEEEVEKEEPSNPDELTAAELEEAQRLYKAIRADPKGSVKQLMDTVGLRLDEIPVPETKEEVKSAKKAALDILKEELGDQLKFLAEPLGKVLDRVLEQERQDNLHFQQSVEARETESQVIRATEKLAAETKGESRKFEAKMLQLADQLQPGKGVTVEQYIRNLYILASNGSTTKKVQTTLADKIRKNANDTPSRIASGAGGGRDTREMVPKQAKTLDEAVRIAQRQLEKQQGK